MWATWELIWYKTLFLIVVCEMNVEEPIVIPLSMQKLLMVLLNLKHFLCDEGEMVQHLKWRNTWNGRDLFVLPDINPGQPLFIYLPQSLHTQSGDNCTYRVCKMSQHERLQRQTMKDYFIFLWKMGWEVQLKPSPIFLPRVSFTPDTHQGTITRATAVLQVKNSVLDNKLSTSLFFFLNVTLHLWHMPFFLDNSHPEQEHSKSTAHFTQKKNERWKEWKGNTERFDYLYCFLCLVHGDGR